MIGMLDLRSAGQLVGLLLLARVLAYGFVRLIEFFKPRPVHFIITALMDRKLEALSNEKVAPLGVEHRQRWKLNDYCYYLIWAALSRNCKIKPRPSLKLITEMLGLLTAGISLTVLIVECFFR
jgi:hypothetical protein